MDEARQTIELIQKYVDESASEAELAALEHRLMHDPQAAEALANAIRLETGLARIFCAEGRTAEVLAQLSATEPVSRLSLRERPSIRRAKGDKGAWRMAAAVLLAVGAIWLLYRFTGPRAAPPPAGAEWNQIVSGDVLVNGVAAQAMHDGSSLQVMGDSPAVVRLRDGSRAEFEPGATALIHGRLDGLRQWVELNEGCGTFRVENAPGEFRVATQMGCVTASDTEFSVGIQPAGLPGGMLMKLPAALLVAVLSGAAQVEFAGQSYVLEAGESRVFAQQQVQPAPAAVPRRPATNPPPGTRRAQAANTVRGPLLSIDPAKVTLGGRIRQTEFEFNAGALLTIDGKPAAIEQFDRGMLVSVERKDGQGPIIRMHAEGATIGGSLKSLDEESKTITITTAGSEQTYVLAGDAVITQDGQVARLSDFQPGTAVSLKLSVDQKTVVAVSRRPRRGP